MRPRCKGKVNVDSISCVSDPLTLYCLKIKKIMSISQPAYK